MTRPTPPASRWPRGDRLSRHVHDPGCVLVGQRFVPHLIEVAPKQGWSLVTADYCVAEIERYVLKHPAGATRWTQTVQKRIGVVGSIYVLDRPIVFDATKDRPVVLSAIGSDADYLVTSDTTDFAHILGTTVYGVNIRTPKTFLLEVGVVRADPDR